MENVSLTRLIGCFHSPDISRLITRFSCRHMTSCSDASSSSVVSSWWCRWSQDHLFLFVSFHLTAEKSSGPSLRTNMKPVLLNWVYWSMWHSSGVTSWSVADGSCFLTFTLKHEASAVEAALHSRWILFSVLCVILCCQSFLAVQICSRMNGRLCYAERVSCAVCRAQRGGMEGGGGVVQLNVLRRGKEQDEGEKREKPTETSVSL